MNPTPAKNRRLRPCARSFLGILAELLTPAIWKQAEQARRGRRQPTRWATQPLVLCLLITTWCCGDSQAERFEVARGCVAACRAKRRRPGKSVSGFQRALRHLPVPVLRGIAAGLRRRLLALFELCRDGFIALGCDGSSLETPRTEELERRLDPPLKGHARPQVWVTALVHLRTGLPWAWRLGKGYNRERSHLRALLPTLPAAALVVADAGYNGFELAQALSAAGASFLIRVSGKDRLYVERPAEAVGRRDGPAWLWPQEARRGGEPPVPVRVLCLPGRQRGRDVWLLTNVLERRRLSAALAGRYYRWRWENEGLFRTFKRTLAKVRLTSRTLRLLHREAEGALLATQLLLAQGARGVGSAAPREAAARRCSARQVLLVIRDVIRGRIGVRDAVAYQRRLARALREQRRRTSAKVKRVWPSRTPHKPMKPPRFLTLSEDLWALGRKRLRAPT